MGISPVRNSVPDAMSKVMSLESGPYQHSAQATFDDVYALCDVM
jgi:hypothetical protein